jgi:tetratricopeptide (TPR) repeat protein
MVWLVLGLLGMAPSISFGDSGEFAAAAASLGIAHAPGYPLWSLMAHALGSLLPWGTWAYITNFSSVLCGAGAATLLFSALRRGPGGSAGAVLAAASLALSPLWLHTTLQTEVFALHMLAATAVLWIYMHFSTNLFAPRPMAAMGLVLGLGGANHHTLILIVPAVLLGGALQTSRFDRRQIVQGLLVLVGFALLGLSVYLYLPIRSRTFPALDWGHPVDLPRFLHVLLRKDYGSFSLTIDGQASGGPWAQTLRFIRDWLHGCGWLGVAAAGLGLAHGVYHKQRDWIMPVLWVLLAGPAFLWLGNPPFDAQTSYALQRFFLLPWLGAAVLVARAPLWLPAPARRWAPALVLVPLLYASYQSAHWYQRWDLAADDYGRNLLRSLPKDAALFMDGGDDSFYSTAYLTIAEGLRKDVELHDRGGLVFANPYGPDFRKIDKAAKETRRLQVEREYARRRPLFYATLKRMLISEHRLDAHGLLRRSVSAQTPPSPSGLWHLYPQRFSPPLAKAHYRYRALVPFYAAMRAEVEPPLRALSYLHEAAAMGEDVRWVPGLVSHRAQHLGFHASKAKKWPLAERAYLFASNQAPEQVAPLLNLGVALEEQGRIAEAEARYRQGVALDPKSYQARFNLGALLWKQRRFAEAAPVFEEAARVRPGDAAAKRYAERARARVKG